MKSIGVIKKDISGVRQELYSIKEISKTHSYFSMAAKQESLVERIENIRVSIQDLFLRFPDMRKVCKSLLERLLDVSEDLKLTYFVPAYYTESFDIADTIKMVKG